MHNFCAEKTKVRSPTSVASEAPLTKTKHECIIESQSRSQIRLKQRKEVAREAGGIRS